MNIITLLLLLTSFILFVLATFGVSTRFNLVAAGLACWVFAVEILPYLVR